MSTTMERAFIRATEKSRCDQRRARVLAHPDIAARLTQRPLGYARPEEWNGYIPPATFSDRTNDSPRRRALLQILADVVEAERA